MTDDREMVAPFRKTRHQKTLKFALLRQKVVGIIRCQTQLNYGPLVIGVGASAIRNLEDSDRIVECVSGAPNRLNDVSAYGSESRLSGFYVVDTTS